MERLKRGRSPMDSQREQPDLSIGVSLVIAMLR